MIYFSYGFWGRLVDLEILALAEQAYGSKNLTGMHLNNNNNIYVYTKSNKYLSYRLFPCFQCRPRSITS